jgi:shikimate kinase
LSDSPRASPRIILLGPRGAGKSAAGRILAERLGVGFADLDVLVQRAALKPIARIFDEDGEATFRELETDALKQALAGDAGVIATGGGVVLRAPNRDRLMHADAARVLLMASPAVLWHRVSADPDSIHMRPALTHRDGEDEIRHLLENRMPFYERVATHHLDTSLHTPAETAQEILAMVGTSPKATA